MFQGCVRLKTHSTHTIVEIRLAFLLAYEGARKADEADGKSLPLQTLVVTHVLARVGIT